MEEINKNEYSRTKNSLSEEKYMILDKLSEEDKKQVALIMSNVKNRRFQSVLYNMVLGP